MPFAVIFTVRDGKGKQSTTKVNLPESTDWADVVEFAQEMAQIIQATITGAITRVGIAYEVDISALGLPAPDVQSDVEEGALFMLKTVQNHSTRLRIPTFGEAYILPGTRAVDLTDGAVAALVTALTDGLTLTSTNTVQPCDSREEDIAADGLYSAQEMFQASRN